jgi:hypothetical protein
LLIQPITRRIKHVTRSKKAFDQSRQLLSPIEEQAIVKWAIQYFKWGLPLGIHHLRQFAVEILLRKGLQQALFLQGNTRSLGEHWHSALLARNPEIKRIIARGLDRTRAAAILNYDTFKEYFELYSSLQQQYNIKPQDTYNMDEKGFCMGQIQRTHVLVPSSEKQAFVR